MKSKILTKEDAVCVSAWDSLSLQSYFELHGQKRTLHQIQDCWRIKPSVIYTNWFGTNKKDD